MQFSFIVLLAAFVFLLILPAVLSVIREPPLGIQERQTVVLLSVISVTLIVAIVPIGERDWLSFAGKIVVLGLMGGTVVFLASAKLADHFKSKFPGKK